MKKIAFIAALGLLTACGNGEVHWDATGTFETTEVIVSAEGTGQLVEFALDEGDQLVRETQVGYIDTIQLHLKKLQLLSSQKGALSRRSDVGKQIAAIEQQIAWQTSEKQRFQKLFSQNAATQKQVDDISNQIAVLQRQLAAQRSTLENTNRSLGEEGSALDVQVAQIDDQIRRARITSPISGTVLLKYAEQGEFTATGKPLFMVADTDQFFLRAYVTADLLTQMKLGQEVKVYADFGADEQREYPGKVTWISEQAEFTPKTIQTRKERANLVYAVKIAVKNDGYLKRGMYGQMKL